jgi:hypothetical protein
MEVLGGEAAGGQETDVEVSALGRFSSRIQRDGSDEVASATDPGEPVGVVDLGEIEARGVAGRGISGREQDLA